MVYGIYNERTRACAYARAGHPRPLVLGPGDRLVELPGEGPLLGIFPEADFEACTCRLEPGSRLLFYSDGAEAVGASPAGGPARLLALVRDLAARPVDEMLDALVDAVRFAAAGGPLQDDVTFLALDLPPAD
jgi:serine phosphatase RsbU (regulator of sigma subunit)